jgi:hypothetical protein
MFDMINIFEVFLPQLLRYPNPTDPLNGEAAALLMRDAKSYEVKVKGNVLANVFARFLVLNLYRVCFEICHQGVGRAGRRRERVRVRDEFGW